MGWCGVLPPATISTDPLVHPQGEFLRPVFMRKREKGLAERKETGMYPCLNGREWTKSKYNVYFYITQLLENTRMWSSKSGAGSGAFISGTSGVGEWRKLRSPWPTGRPPTGLKLRPCAKPSARRCRPSVKAPSLRPPVRRRRACKSWWSRGSSARAPSGPFGCCRSLSRAGSQTCAGAYAGTRDSPLQCSPCGRTT